MSKLYFYLVPDDFPDDEVVNTFEAECIGGIDMNCFLGMQLKGVFDSNHEYYESFRYKLQTVREMRAGMVSRQLKETDDGRLVFPLLEDAISMESGLYAECETVS